MISNKKMRAGKCGELKLKIDFLATFGQPELLPVSQFNGHRHPRRRVLTLTQYPMKEPGLDGRHRDKASPKAGEIQQKRSDTLNKNLPTPIPQFRADATLGHMRQVTGKTSVQAVRKAAEKR